MENLKKIKWLLNYVQRNDLSAPTAINHSSLAYLQRVFNGCGPEWLPAEIRLILDCYFSLFEPCFFVHDFRFARKNNKSRGGFNRANNELLKNMLKVIAQEISWKDPFFLFGVLPIPFWKKIRAKRQAYIIYNACQLFGFSAYVSGGK